MQKANSKGNIHSETFFILILLKFIITLPFLILVYLFSKKARESIKNQTKILKSFFLEAKITNYLIIFNVLMFLVQIFYLNNSGFVENYVLKYQGIFLFPHTFFAHFICWFLHASIIHILLNMLALFIFGRIIEKEYGSKIWLIYFGSAIVSSILSGIMGEIGVGASGAIAGLISTAILIKPFYFTFYPFIFPIPIMILGWFMIYADISGIIYGAKDNIGHFAHLGGYVSIMFFVFLSSKKDRKKLIKGLIINAIFISFILIWNFIIKK